MRDLLQKLTCAADLVRERMRPPIVARLLDVPQSVVAKLWRETHCEAPPRGRFTDGPETMLARRSDMPRRAAAFYGFYRLVGPDEGERIDAAALLKAYRLYRRFIEKQEQPIFTLQDGMTITTAILSGLLQEKYCTRCAVRWLYTRQSGETGRNFVSCPFCPPEGRS